MSGNRASTERFLSLMVTVASLDVVDRALQAIFAKIARSRIWCSDGPLHLCEVYHAEPPSGGAHLFKVAIYSPRVRSDSCVFVSNLQDGWNSLCGLIAKEHRQFQIQIISTSLDAEYPKNKLEVWRNGESSRTVMAMRESDKWIFHQTGEPEEFEQSDMYNERTIRKRLTRESIIGCLERIGWEVTNPAFWETNTGAVYFEERWKS